MIRRSTWYALGGLAAMILAAALWSRMGGQHPLTQSDLTPTPSPLWTVESSAVEQLVIESGEGEVLLAAARDASVGWRLEQPTAGLADPGRLERAVSWLASPPVRAVIEAPDDLKPFELDPPRYRVKVLTRQGAEHTFAVGREAPTGDTVYAWMPGMTAIALLSGFGVQEVLGLLEPLPLLPIITPGSATVEP
jgi:hypothetical protein